MFQELHELLAQVDAVNLLVVPVGKELSVSVIPKVKAGKDVHPALRQQFQLRGTPEELDAEFINHLQSFANVRKSLVEQAKATEVILQQGTTALAKKATTGVNPIDDDDDESDQRATPPAGGNAAPSTTTENSAFNLFNGPLGK